MKCPDCKGDGRQPVAFPHSLEMCTIPCTRCHGTRHVPEQMSEWVEAGKKLKDKRIEKRITLRNVCKRLNLDPQIVSQMERGVIPPNMDMYDTL